MTANMIRSYDRTNLFTDDELQLDKASYSNKYQVHNTHNQIIWYLNMEGTHLPTISKGTSN